VRDIIGVRPGAPGLATLNALLLEHRTLFVTDPYVNEDPSPELLASIARMAAEEVRNFGLPPKVAFLSHSNFGSSQRPSALKMRRARDLFRQFAPDIECDGEMQGDMALLPDIRQANIPDSTLSGEANLLVCPTLDAANILFNVLKITSGGGVTIGPMLLGAAAPAHVLNPSATVRRLVNMTALAVAEATTGTW
jgi:malate dehydrogenase (oxaloacetate-decarboxylating)(NADP+)